jgi:hypothetical protein
MVKGEKYDSDPAAILEASWQGDHTVPVPGTYPHQWFTDSALASIGWGHINPDRGETEIRTLLDRGQWANGMVPHQIYSSNKIYDPRRVPWDKYMWWRSQRPADAPKYNRTSGITQPPLLAEASWSVTQNLDADRRQHFLNYVVPRIEDFHAWMYRERDFGGEGLIATLHPYESGLNYTPPWITHMQEATASRLVRAASQLPVDRLVKAFRPDKLNEDRDFSIGLPAGILAVSATLGLGKIGFDDPEAIREKWPYQVEDVLFNSVLIRNNQILREMAAEAGIDLPDELEANMARTEAAFDELYVPAKGTGQKGAYYSRPVDGDPIKILALGSLAPVYAGILTKERINEIQDHLKDEATFGLAYPIPTVAANSEHFNPEKEDEGGVKPPMNWLIAKGLLEAGRKEAARDLSQATLRMMESSEGLYAKAYSPVTGKPLDKNRSAATAAAARDAWTIASAPLILRAAFRAILRKAA